MEHEHIGNADVRVWSGIMVDVCVTIHVLNIGFVIDLIYVDEVLEFYVKLYRGTYGSDILFQSDKN